MQGCHISRSLFHTSSLAALFRKLLHQSFAEVVGPNEFSGQVKMAYRYDNGDGSPSEKHSPSEEGHKPPYSYEQYSDQPITSHHQLSDPRDAHHSLHRGLSARQVTMIAIGGAIGTGLIIGTGAALVHSGPGSILISYSIIGLLCYAVMTALGEMATWLPAAGGFAVYATRVRVRPNVRWTGNND